MWYSIATVDNDTAIVERLKDIEKILTDGVNAIRTYQESNKELKVGPLRAEIAFDPQSKEDNQTEANRQYATQEGIRKTAIAAFCIGFLFAGFAFAQGVFGFPQDKTMYIQGRITYDDIFGGKHETRFCYWYASPGTFPMCNDHNYVN